MQAINFGIKCLPTPTVHLEGETVVIHAEKIFCHPERVKTVVYQALEKVKGSEDTVLFDNGKRIILRPPASVLTQVEEQVKTAITRLEDLINQHLFSTMRRMNEMFIAMHKQSLQATIKGLKNGGSRPAGVDTGSGQPKIIFRLEPNDIDA